MVRLSRALACAFTSAAVSAAGIAAWPGTALASAANITLWVSHATAVAGHGTSCRHPGYNAIQPAISAAPRGGTIEVCRGTYVGQLQITRSVSIVGVGVVVVRLPASPVNSTTACDTAQGTGSFQPDQDGVAICGKGAVSLIHLRINAAWAGSTCYDSLYGILVGGGATVRFIDSAVVAAGAVPLNGCQGGIGIQDGMAWTTPNEVGHLILTNSSVSGYQKNGITVDGKGSTAQIHGALVEGIGATTQIAQNGIQVSNGARAQIQHSTITGNECDVSVCGPDGLTQTQSTGLLFYAAARGSTVSHSLITHNDIGVYYSADPAGPPPGSPALSVTWDTLTDNRYEAVVLDQGSADISHCHISWGNEGIEILQYGPGSGFAGQTFGSTSVASHDILRHIQVATIRVLSDRSATADKRGRFVISRSEIDTAPVRDNSRNLPIVRRFDY